MYVWYTHARYLHYVMCVFLVAVKALLVIVRWATSTRTGKRLTKYLYTTQSKPYTTSRKTREEARDLAKKKRRKKTVSADAELFMCDKNEICNFFTRYATY